MKDKVNFRILARAAAVVISTAVVTSFASPLRNAGIAQASLDIENYGSGGKPYSVLMTIPCSFDSRGFAWQTDSSQTNCSITVESNGRKTFFAGETIRMEELGISCHKVVASKLSPGRYKYEIKSLHIKFIKNIIKIENKNYHLSLYHIFRRIKEKRHEKSNIISINVIDTFMFIV